MIAITATGRSVVIELMTCENYAEAAERAWELIEHLRAGEALVITSGDLHSTDQQEKAR
jgi:hypothetical protein